MRAVILAGGLGTRLRPYTTVIPKPLVPIGERPVLEHIIRSLAKCGTDRIDLCVNYLGDLILVYLAQIDLPPELRLAFHWEDEARVMRQSPHHFVGSAKTPTLVIHGELDYRVPATQALQYYDTLKAKGVPARLVYFPDENHWILKPQNSRLWFAEFFAWLARHAAAK